VAVPNLDKIVEKMGMNSSSLVKNRGERNGRLEAGTLSFIGKYLVPVGVSKWD
jgi:hypothetical protein